MTYDAYDETQWWSRCARGHLKNPGTRWCCRECWIDQRKDYTYHTAESESEASKSSDWTTLKLHPPKTNSEIRKQYHKLALLFHPDRTAGNHDKFTQLNASYHNLIM